MSSTPTPPRPTRRRVALLLLVLTAAGAGYWWHRATRPDARLARGEAALAAGDWDSAERAAERLEKAGASDHARFLRGRLHHARKRPDLALAEFNRVEVEGPLRLRAATLAGRCLLDLGALREAHRVLAAVVREQPHNVDAQRSLAAAAYDMGQLAYAAEVLEKVAELDPSDARPHRLIGLINKDMAQWAAAAAAYREALRRGLPGGARADVRVELAAVLIQQGLFAEALTALDAEPGPDRADRSARRAEALRGVGRKGEAAELLDRTVPPSGEVFRVRGQLFLDESQYADAVRVLERAVQLAPADFEAHYLLGQALAGLGRADEAKQALARSEAVKKDFAEMTALSREAMEKPWDAGVRLKLAGVCERVGRAELAAMWRAAAAACTGQTR